MWEESNYRFRENGLVCYLCEVPGGSVRDLVALGQACFPSTLGAALDWATEHDRKHEFERAINATLSDHAGSPDDTMVRGMSRA